MNKLLGKILKWLLYVAAAGIMLLALLVGIARLFLPLVPEYQEDIRQWTAQATGYDVEFRSITASWPLAGPELKFIDVVVSSRDSGEQVFVADNLTAGISLFMLVRERKILLNRLGVEGSSIAVRRTADGDYFIQGLSLNDFLPAETGREDRLQLRLPDILIRLQAIELNFTDEADAVFRPRFGIRTLDVRLSDERVSAAGEIAPDQAFGEAVTVAIDIPTALFDRRTDDNGNPAGNAADALEWRIELAGSDINLVNVIEYALKKPAPITSASGNLSVAVTFGDLTPRQVSAELDLEAVEFNLGAGDNERLETLSGTIDWQRDAAGRWTLNARDISVESNDLFSSRSDVAVRLSPADNETGFALQASTSFVRLQDLYPLVRLAGREGLLPADMLGEWGLPTSLRGELRNGSLNLQQFPEGRAQFVVAVDFSALGVGGLADGIGAGGLSGTLRADQAGGSLEIDAGDLAVELPTVFAAPIEATTLNGLFVWRVSDDNVHVLSDDVHVRLALVEARSRFEFDWPLNGESPRIDLTGSVIARSAPAVVPLLPMQKFPPAVSAWLKQAILAGRVTNADVSISGPIQKFPFAGNDGEFSVAVDIEDGVLNYGEGWPVISAFSGTLVFDGPGLYSRQNRGRIGQIEFVDSQVRIENFREGQLKVEGRHTASVAAVINFLRSSPLAATIGPILNDVTGAGLLDARVRLSLPVTRPADYQLNMAVTPRGISLGLSTLDWGLSAIDGSLTLQNTRFRATGLTATLLDEPVSIDLLPAGEAEGQYGQYIRVIGRTPVQRWAQTLALPFADRLEGPVGWNALVMVPRLQEDLQAPVHILVRSDLVGMQSRLPAPLAKSWPDVRPLEIDLAFPAEGRLELSGRLQDQLTWAFALVAADDRWEIGRGAVHAGTAMAILPASPGVEITGRLPELVFDDWLSLADGDDGEASDWQQTWNSALLQIDRLTLFEQSFDAVQVEAEQSDGYWQIALDAEAIAGQVRVPLDAEALEPIVLDLDRLWLRQSDADEAPDNEPEDPRLIPSAEVAVGDFSLNDMRFGSLEMSVTNISGGIRIDPIRTRAAAFSIDGNAAWLVHPNVDALRQSSLALNLSGTDIKGVLTALGYDPVIEGRSVTATGELTWLGGPRGDFLERADGTISIGMKEGALLDLEPGGGRLLGILSVAALPRRLAFDFSDVVDEGLAFNSLKGDFTFDDGNAYTCNLSMEGPVADMGIVGRAGIATRDYDQIAVVRPHMSNLMAAGGFVVGGPVAGAAMLLFSQIFQKPLSTLGESYHSVTGSWDEPKIEQLRGSDIDSTPLRNCEKFLSEAITESLKE